MKKSNIVLEVKVGRKTLTISCDEDEAAAVFLASERFQEEINEVGEVFPSESPQNRILLAGINIADSLIKAEEQPRVKPGLINKVKNLTDKAEKAASKYRE